MSEVSYSENGRPATVERKTMKYSTDPSDFAHEIDSDYKTSTSERKSSRGGVYSVTKLEKFQDDGKSTSSKTNRHDSVKELKDKFVKKDSSSSVTESENESSTVSKHHKSSTSSQSKSFLNSEKKASNVQDVLSYMKNADHGKIKDVPLRCNDRERLALVSSVITLGPLS